MFGDSQALFTDSNAIFSPNLSPREQQQENNLVFAKSKMNFDMNNIIQDSYNNKSEDCNEDFMGESLNDDVNHKSLSSGFVLNNSEMMSGYTTRPSSSSGLATTQIGGLDNPGLYRMASSSGMENHVNMTSGLVRQSSSPAGFFSHLTSQSGYGGIRGGVGNYRLGNGCNGELSPTASRLKSHTSLSSRIPSSLGMLSRISEVDGGNIGPTNHDNAKNQSVHGETQYYNSEYPLSSWNDSLHFAENYSVLKREIEDDEMLFSSPQKGENPNRPSLLSHHLSLPKTSSDASYMDKLLKFQDSVPCKIRAKRGCATHPRSIAERVRRTRISERMRKLQELVPHMDKQTNTADMLDLAVEYIKDLQKQYKTLGDSRKNCRCSAMQKQSIE